MEQFIETIEYLLSQSKMSCEDFFKTYSKPLTKERSIKFLLAAMVRLCGSETTFGKLALKYSSLSYINPDIYQ